MKKLRDIIEGIKTDQVIGPSDININQICFDSRSVGARDIFVAIPGTLSDGHEFIGQAIKQGATAILCERVPDPTPGHITVIQVKDSHDALGRMAANYYGHPSKDIRLVGITGTNGKTTIATLLYLLFKALGYGTGLLSTIQYKIFEDSYPSSHTTPDALQINRLLRELADRGGEYCFMEVSSHAISQNRISGLQFSGGVFTNITHEHLDYHKTFQDYLKAKKHFFDGLPETSFALINADDRNSQVMVQNTAARVYTYALMKPADFKTRVMESSFEGLQLVTNEYDVFCRLTGLFNAYNLTAIFGVASLLNQDPRTVLTILSNLKAVEGRFDTIRSATRITGIIDYAHTPDALKNVLGSINSMRTRNEKLITVVGAGGNRDRTKRPLMGLICAEESDLVIFTSDNPRYEDPEEIIQEMRQGISPDLKSRSVSISNRKEAIGAAVQMARPGDIILVAGKGHEKYQEIRGEKYPFDDRQILSEFLTALEPKEN